MHWMQQLTYEHFMENKVEKSQNGELDIMGFESYQPAVLSITNILLF